MNEKDESAYSGKLFMHIFGTSCSPSLHYYFRVFIIILRSSLLFSLYNRYHSPLGIRCPRITRSFQPTRGSHCPRIAAWVSTWLVC